MFRTRFWMLLAAAGLTIGPLLATAGYGLYLRSGMYSNALAQRASKFMRCPVQIGGVVPMGLSSRALRDVSLWLPGEFSPIFTCKTAIIRLTDSNSVEVVLRDGRIEPHLHECNQETLKRLLTMALAHDFRRAHLRIIRLENMELIARCGKATIWARGASGQVDLSGPTGRADLSCDGLNGVPAGEPVRIHCDFEPGDKPLVRELSLSVQRLGLEAFAACRGQQTAGSRVAGRGSKGNGQDTAQSQPCTSNENTGQAEACTPQDGPDCGWLSGRIVYRQKDPASLAGVVELAGSLADVDLATLARLAGKPDLAGTINAVLDRAVLDDGRLESITGRARIEDLDVRGLLRLAGLPETPGRASLDLHELRYEAGQIQALLAEARVRDLQAGPLVEMLQAGTLTGQLNATLQKLKIVDGRLEALTGEVRMTPPDGQAGSIDRSLLEAAAQRLLHLSVPPILPEQVPYAALGAKFNGEGDDLYIDGAVGPGEKFILVADLGSVPLPLVPAPPGPVAMGDLRASAVAQVNRLMGLLTGADPWNLARR